MYRKFQFYEDSYHDVCGKALKTFFEAKMKRDDHLAMGTLHIYPKLTTPSP